MLFPSGRTITAQGLKNNVVCFESLFMRELHFYVPVPEREEGETGQQHKLQRGAEEGAKGAPQIQLKAHTEQHVSLAQPQWAYTYSTTSLSFPT